MKVCKGLLCLLAAGLAVVVGFILQQQNKFAHLNLDEQLGRGGRGGKAMGSGHMFDDIAGKYDLINKVMTMGLDGWFRENLIDSLELKPGDKVLDLATGTADVALMVARRMQAVDADAGGKVLGIDPSVNMIRVGKEKAKQEGLKRKVKLQLGDAQHLEDVDNDSYDKVTMAFGIRNVENRAKALKEMRRVAKPGGIVSILEVQQPHSGALAPVAKVFIETVAPLVGRLTGKAKEYQHLQRSIADFPLSEQFVVQMGMAGLPHAKHTALAFDTIHIYTSRIPDEP